MQGRKLGCSIGLMLVWLLAGKLSPGCAQTPILPLLPVAKVRLTSANVEEPSAPLETPGTDGPRPPTKPYTCFPDFCSLAQDQPSLPDLHFSWPRGDVLHQPLHVLDDNLTLFKGDATPRDSAPMSRTPRLQMFRMPAGFVATPIGMESDDDSFFGGDDPANKSSEDDAVQVIVGRHVPNLGMYRHGDPGGLGYYRVHSQVRIFDYGTSSMCFGLQAYTPIGQGMGEVLNGPTTIIPNLSCFQELYPGTALHAYIAAKPVNTDGRWRDDLCSGFRCGLAVQQPLPLVPCNAEQGMFLFLQTLGQCGPDTLRGDMRATSWEFIPGVQWRLNSACWMSMGISHHNFLSCSWQY